MVWNEWSMGVWSIPYQWNTDESAIKRGRDQIFEEMYDM